MKLEICHLKSENTIWKERKCPIQLLRYNGNSQILRLMLWHISLRTWWCQWKFFRIWYTLIRAIIMQYSPTNFLSFCWKFVNSFVPGWPPSQKLSKLPCLQLNIWASLNTHSSSILKIRFSFDRKKKTDWSTLKFCYSSIPFLWESWDIIYN